MINIIDIEEADGTPFNDWVNIIRWIIVNEYGYTKKQAKNIDTDILKESYQNDLSCEDAAKIHFGKNVINIKSKLK